MDAKIRSSFEKLKSYCEAESFKGYDPYDGLNSRFFQSLPIIKNNRIAKLIWIQAFKRLPFNLRRIFAVKKDYNPKAMGLFLSGYCALYQKEPLPEYLEKIRFFIDKIEKLTTDGWSGKCWGYNFDWQARAFFQPKFTPTVVATTFVAHSLLDAYEILKEEKLLSAARSACDFILKDLNRTYDDKGNFAFSYSPLDTSVVFNASLLGSRLLARVYSYSQEKELLEEAKKSVDFCCKFQKNNGEWPYGTYSFHQWVDNFHTGYNLECISDYMSYSKDYSYKKNLELGFEYYINTFFTEEGIPKYYNNSVYPIDIHTTSQLIITLIKLEKLSDNKDLMERVLNWTIENMQSPKGFFYFQLKKYISSKIPYMRWAQAWMFYAFAYFLSKADGENGIINVIDKKTLNHYIN